MTFPSSTMGQHTTAHDSSMLMLPISTVLHRRQDSLRLSRSLAIMATGSRQVRIALNHMTVRVGASRHGARIVVRLALDNVGDLLVDIYARLSSQDGSASSQGHRSPRRDVDVATLLKDRDVAGINEVQSCREVGVYAVPLLDERIVAYALT